MQYLEELKKISLSFGYICVGILSLATITTALYYFNWIGSNTYHIFQLLIPLLSTLFGGIIIGKKTKEKGWQEGLKLGALISILFFLFSYFGISIKIKWTNMLYFFILILLSTFGSMIGINQKTQK